MKVRVQILKTILEHLSEKTGHAIDFPGLRSISEMIGELGSDYLYKKILLEIKTKDDEELHGVRDFHLNKILGFLGFSSLNSFEAHLHNPPNDQLVSLVGNYYSYVRANYQSGIVLRSPVRIVQSETEINFNLIGKEQTYSGPLRIKDGCLFILMFSGEGKCFHHVYKIGNRKKPIVMQGVFSGVSTAFDPIGGRTVLIRQETSFDSLTNKKLSAEEMISSSSIEESRVGSYFRNYYNNNLSPSKSSDFGYDDLTQ